jgi:hypothetical protein
LEVARSSFLKLINKEPPNGENNQQFKDGVIWAHCLELLNTDDVIFVTQDKGFFQNKDYKKGLALNLLEETKQKHNTFTIISSINDLLEQIKTQIEIDKKAMIKGIFDKLSDSIQKIIQDNDLELIGEPLLDLKLFITEQPNLLYINFIFNQIYKSVIPREIDNANVEIEGHCMYNTDTLLFTELQNNREKVTYKLEDGEEKTIQNISLMVGNIIIGHKTNIYSIRKQID